MPQTSLLVQPSDDLKREIVQRLWRQDNKDLAHYDLYFSYYAGLCERLSSGVKGEIIDMSARDHEDVLSIIDIVWNFIDTKHHLKRPDLRQKLQDVAPFQKDSDFELNNAINFALRMWLTMTICAAEYGESEGIQWDDSTDLGDFVKAQFPELDNMSELSQHRNVVLDIEFTAAILYRFCRIHVKSTNDIRKHLYLDTLDDGHKVLNIYPMRYCLQAHRDSKACIIPDSVIVETIKSLGILFPPDWKTHQFIEKHYPDIRTCADYPFAWLGNTRPRLAEFPHWQERLTNLYLEYRKPPSTIVQKFLDIRNPVEWYSFWGAAVTVVVATIFFGLITSITAIMSTVYAYQALQIARDAASSAAATASDCVPSTCGFPPARTLGPLG